MFRTLQHQFLLPARRSRLYSQQLAGATQASSTQNARYPYFVPRNSKGSIPVYTDIRSQTKYLTLIRNVDGNANALAADLANTLVKPGSPEATRLKITTVRGRHVVLSGGDWKRAVVQWLQERGF